jgi:hypothetical protein
MPNQNSESADVKVPLEGRRLEFIESRRRRQTKIPPRVEIIRQLIDEAIESEGKNGEPQEVVIVKPISPPIATPTPKADGFNDEVPF